MSYIDGFVLPVPAANRQKFIDHANLGDAVFMEQGATRILECWEEDVPHGTLTDFYRSVDGQDGESVLFSWIEWPSKEAREKGMAAVMDAASTDPRIDPEQNPMPFDGKRMIYGGFAPIFEGGTPNDAPYVQGFIIPVAHEKREAYRAMAADAWGFFAECGALRVVEAWGDDVPEGKHTDFRMAVKANESENVVFSWIEWPSRAVCDAANEKMQHDDRMQMPEGAEMPFDGKRMVFGGFTPVVKMGQ